MALFDKIGHFFSFGRKDNMAQTNEFEPTDVIKHRYQDPHVLINYVKTLPDGFTDDKIKVKSLRDGRLGMRLPRKLQKEELEGALNAFIRAERERQRDDED